MKEMVSVDLRSYVNLYVYWTINNHNMYVAYNFDLGTIKVLN